MTPKRYFAVVNFSPRYSTKAYEESQEAKTEKQIFNFFKKLKNKILRKKD